MKIKNIIVFPLLFVFLPILGGCSMFMKNILIDNYRLEMISDPKVTLYDYQDYFGDKIIKITFTSEEDFMISNHSGRMIHPILTICDNDYEDLNPRPSDIYLDRILNGISDDKRGFFKVNASQIKGYRYFVCMPIVMSISHLSKTGAVPYKTIDLEKEPVDICLEIKNVYFNPFSVGFRSNKLIIRKEDIEKLFKEKTKNGDR